MNQALATRNYDGTFFHLSEGRVETMRIVHRVKAGLVTERLQSLDGSGREFVRNNDELTCYLPDQHTVLVEPRQVRGPFLGIAPPVWLRRGPVLPDRVASGSHVLGRAAQVIAVNPKDQYRFGYRLWLDEKTAMPLKTQLCDAHGQVIEQILFARLDMPETISDADLTPAVRTEGMRWVRQGASDDSAVPALSAYRASELPPGFRLTVSGAQTLGGATVPAPTWSTPTAWPPCRSSWRRRRSLSSRCQRLIESPARPPDAGPGPRRLGIRFLHGGAGTPGDGGGRGSGSDRRVHRPLGQILRRGEIGRSCVDRSMGFTLYSRPGCCLCEELLAELSMRARGAGLSDRGAGRGCRPGRRAPATDTRYRCSFCRRTGMPRAA